MSNRVCCVSGQIENPISSMDFPIEISSGSEDDEHEPIRLPDGTIVNDERLIYQAALQDLNQPKTERDLPPGVLSVSLMRHQKIALEWMRQKEKRSSRNCLGGMLADDQGLGKTISTIALILLQKLKSQAKHKRPKSRKHGGTLVVCPASVVKQWAKEIYDKVSDEHKLSVLVYHGSNRTRDHYELAKYDVVVTTYALVTNEVPPDPRLDLYDERSNKGREDIIRIQRRSGALARVKWSRVVLDEAQTIKNHKTLVARSCCSLRAKRRWCLSGTPIQNEIFDLYSYFKFLRYHPYAKANSFTFTILGPIKNNSLRGYKKLQAILRAIMLRRTKETSIDGQRILNLPPKVVNLSKVDFAPEEMSFYRDLEAKAQFQFEEYARAGTLYVNYADILVMLLRLRQACDHPRLPFKTKLESLGEKSEEESTERFPKEYMITLLNILESSFTVCSVCNDPPKDPLVALCGHVFCRACVWIYMYGDENKCPVPRCTGALRHDAVFSESKLRSSINEDDDDDDADKKPPSLISRDFTSTKIKALMEILQSLANHDEDKTSSLPIKTIVFSQWTSMLDLIQLNFVKNGINFRRLDGTMSLVTRDIAVKEFNNDPNVEVMLMSLKAGNLGLNMVAACHVILLDLWWNPTTEDQAIDRAHRIGQTRTVTVTRITINDTVEDRILALQATKREIVASALGEDPGELSATRLTVEDLEYLFYGAM